MELTANVLDEAPLTTPVVPRYSSTPYGRWSVPLGFKAATRKVVRLE